LKKFFDFSVTKRSVQHGPDDDDDDDDDETDR
jgi:hypothetical protein